MHRTSFMHVVKDIEANMEGEAYTLNVRTKTGDVWRDYAWQGLEPFSPIYPNEFDVIVLSKCDHPPVYLETSQIESVELAS